jgi:hypothetical protein
MALRSPSERCAVERPILMAGARDIFQYAVGSYKLFRLQILLSSSLSMQSGIQKTRSILVSRNLKVSRVERGRFESRSLKSFTCGQRVSLLLMLRLWMSKRFCSLVGPRTRNVERRRWTCGRSSIMIPTLSQATASIVPEAEK